MLLLQLWPCRSCAVLSTLLHMPPCTPTAIFECHQDRRLTALWEQHGGRPGHLDRIASALDAGVARAAIAARLKALGLKRGVLTEGQARGGCCWSLCLRSPWHHRAD